METGEASRKPQRALRNIGNLNSLGLIFNKILSVLVGRATKEEPRELLRRGHRGGGRPQDAFFFQFKMFSVDSVVEV
jgi:hypothetical protein